MLTFPFGLQAALRQAPSVILVGELRGRDTIDLALVVAETGHLVFAALRAGDVSKIVDRLVGTFDSGDQPAIRRRLAGAFQFVFCQRLVPTTDGGRRPVVEVLKSTMRTREYVEQGDAEGRSLLDAMCASELDGTQHFDGELEKLARDGTISAATALLHATNPGDLRLRLADAGPAHGPEFAIVR